MATKTKAKKTTTVYADFNPEIGAKGCPCPCGGYADEKWGIFSKEELAGPYNCGRPYACCIASFKCRLCKKRVIAKQCAPECD